MKKLLSFIIIGVVIFCAFQVTAFNNFKNNYDVKIESNSDKNDYTHTIFVEVGSCQDCESCGNWDDDIFSIYDSGDYNFEYVEMLAWGYCFWDILNTVAYDWAEIYNIISTPDAIFDGGYQRINNLSQPQGALDTCGARAVKDLESNISLTWLGDSKIQVDIEIINKESNVYNGYIRVPITEIVSRYKNANNNNFHFGFLDFAFNEEISINANDIYKDSIIWDGKEHKDNHGAYFSDLKPGNIKVIMGIFNNDNSYCDETTAAMIPENQAPNIPTIDGPYIIKKGISSQYNFTSIDPEGEDVSYLIDWGDGEITPWSDYQASGTIFSESHIWDSKGNYIIKVKARDINLWESDWQDFEIKVPRIKERYSDVLLNMFNNHFKIFLYYLNIK